MVSIQANQDGRATSKGEKRQELNAKDNHTLRECNRSEPKTILNKNWT